MTSINWSILLNQRYFIISSTFTLTFFSLPHDLPVLLEVASLLSLTKKKLACYWNCPVKFKLDQTARVGWLKMKMLFIRRFHTSFGFWETSWLTYQMIVKTSKSTSWQGKNGVPWCLVSCCYNIKIKNQYGHFLYKFLLSMSPLKVLKMSLSY